jgi:hypothetical protein
MQAGALGANAHVADGELLEGDRLSIAARLPGAAQLRGISQRSCVAAARQEGDEPRAIS